MKTTLFIQLISDHHPNIGLDITGLTKDLPPDLDSLDLARLETLIAKIHDTHTKIGWHPDKFFYKPKGYRVVYIENKFLLLHQEKFIGELLSVDGIKPSQIISQWIPRIASSTKNYLSERALNYVLIDTAPSKAELLIKIGNKKSTLKLKRQIIVFQPFKDNFQCRIKDGIAIMTIRSWTDRAQSLPTIDRVVNYLSQKKITGLIIDVRGNQGGDSYIANHLAGHFFTHRTLFGTTYRRSPNKKSKMIKNDLHAEPLPPHLPAPIIIITDALCLSSNEYFITGMKDNGRALTVGQTTGGSSGSPIKITIPWRNIYFELFVSTWRYHRPNGRPLESIGIKPDVEVNSTIKSTKTNDDIVLKEAIRMLKK